MGGSVIEYGLLFSYGYGYGYMCLSVSVHLCLSQVSVPGVVSKDMDRLIRFLAYRLFSTSPTLCYKEILVPTNLQNKGTFL